MTRSAAKDATGARSDPKSAPGAVHVSPLSEFIRDRRVNRILESVRRAVRTGHPVTVAPRDVHYIQTSFARALALGRRRLYELADLILKHFAPGSPVRVTLTVLGRCPDERHARSWSESKADFSESRERLTGSPVSSLAAAHAPSCAACGKRALPVVSFVAHEPRAARPGELLFLTTRIKTTSNIAYKVADLVFDIDRLFLRDKIYSEYSQVVTDVYGVKTVVRRAEDIPAVLKFFWKLPGTSVVEEKDYTGRRHKRSGFEAYKIVIRRWKQLFEIQIQSREMYESERRSRSASHRTYEERLMADRRKIGKEYTEVHKALERLFSDPDKRFCGIDPLAVGLSGKGLDDEF